jgi:signal transduction histidine kinase
VLDLDFPPTLNDHASLAVIRRIHDWVADSVRGADLNHFFQELASIVYEIFGAKLVAVWDNNHRNNCLVLQATAPQLDDVIALHAIPTETSSTGAVVEKNDIVFFRDILHPGGKRHFTNPAIVKKLGLKTMLSIPVFSPIHHDRAGLIINLFFGEEAGTGASIPREDIKRLVTDLGTYIQYLVYRRDEEIADDVHTVAALSKGILSLFDGISEPLQKLTRCTESALFRWDEGRNDLYREAPAGLILDTEGKATRWLSESNDYDEQFDSHIISVCIEQKQPLVARIDEPQMRADWQTPNVQCPYMAMPILSSTNEVLGVIRCKKPVTADKKGASFSSFDLIAVESFSRAMAPSVERFLRLREGSGLMRIVKDVSHALSRAYELDTSLQNMIETLVKAMHSKFGSIYLREGETDTFVIRAATEPSKHLIEQGASYKVGEGLTGVIASGKLLNFRTREELRAYPRRLGKFYTQVWGEGSEEDSDTLLGVPIKKGDSVIGLWKIENVYKTAAHPDPYYTDEDEQVAQVISYFLEYVIQNYKQEEGRLHQFIQLAITSARIQRAPDEDNAIKVVMAALEDAGLAGALLSLYDADTKMISEKEFSGATWTRRDARPCHISEEDIRALTLIKGKEELVKDSTQDSRCRNNPVDRHLKAQYVLPLRLTDEFIGTLQVDVGAHRPSDLELLNLRAFASHLAIAISRRRSIQQTLALTEQIMQSSRFTAAEALSGMAVHSLKHKLGQINEQLKKDLGKKDIRENRLLNETLGEWGIKLKDLEADLKNALSFVRAPVDETQPTVVDLHPEIQYAISTWINYIHSNGCKVKHETDAQRSTCKMPAAPFREIMAVLFVNSVQAHARHIEIKTYNDANVKTTGNKNIRDAFCLECADDGDGLPTADYEKLFEPTYTTKPKNIGTGLGLFVARRLAQRYHGDLEVIEKSRYSKGATFRLSLPLAREPRWPGKGRSV